MKLKRLGVLSTLLAASLSPFVGNADDFPEMTQFSEDGTMFYSAGVDDDGFYDLSTVRNVYLEFSEDDYWTQLESNYNTDTYVYANLTVDDVTYEDVAVQFKGDTSYRNLGSSEKTSFDIKLDYVNEDQDIEGYQTLNFNNAFEDNSMMREVLYCNQIKEHTPAAKANFINLYINGENWGVYANVEQLNKDFMDEWFTNKNGDRWRALSQSDSDGFSSPTGRPTTGPGSDGKWGNGLSALNYLGDSITDYTPNYTIKTNYDDELEEADAWAKLANVCDVLNNTTDEELYDELNAVMDIDGALWFLASELVFSDDDSYVYKGTMDYYLYINPDTGRLSALEYDGNSVLGSGNTYWSIFKNADNANYPLLYRLLNIPETRQRYLSHVRTLLSNVFSPEVIAEKIATYDTLINQLIQDDPKKMMTYADYTAELSNLQTIVETRYDYIMSEEEVVAEEVDVIASIYASAGEANRTPDEGETVVVLAAIDSEELLNLAELNLYYLAGQEGVYTKVAMNDMGVDGDGVAGDGNYAVALPGQAAGTYVRYYIETVSNNTYGTRGYFPAGAEHETYVYRVNPIEESETDSVLVINEIMASNAETIADEWGDYPDWVEIYNNGVLPLSLEGYSLSDDFSEPDKWQFPAITIGVGGYVVVWVDDDEEDQGELHASFKLSKDGEEVLLSDPDGNPIDFIEFGAQETDISFGRSPNGTGDFRSLTPTPGTVNPTVLE